MIDDESLKVIDRFFEVLYDLKARRVIRGKQPHKKPLFIRGFLLWGTKLGTISFCRA